MTQSGHQNAICAILLKDLVDGDDLHRGVIVLDRFIEMAHQ